MHLEISMTQCWHSLIYYRNILMLIGKHQTRDMQQQNTKKFISNCIFFILFWWNFDNNETTYKMTSLDILRYNIIGYLQWRRQGRQVAPHFRFGLFFQFVQIRWENFWGYTTPNPPNFCRFVVPLMKQAMKMHCLTCGYFFCVKH